MRAVYEAFWAEQPRDPEPWAFGERLALLRAAVRPGDRVLDLGCGAGRFTAALGAGAVGVDVAEAALERARENAPAADLRLMDGETIPLAHGAVDLVWCSEVLEHVPGVLGLLQEVRRVLAPGGRLLATTPGHPLPRRVAIAALRFDAHFDPLGQHVRFFTRRSLDRALRAARLEPVRISGGAMLVAEAVRP